jgi:hypothetical protein
MRWLEQSSARCATSKRLYTLEGQCKIRVAGSASRWFDEVGSQASTRGERDGHV